MWWEFYHWVWPLFTACHPGYGLELTLTPADGLPSQVGDQLIPLCPTLAMQLLLCWALFGVICFIWLVSLFVCRLVTAAITANRRPATTLWDVSAGFLESEYEAEPKLEAVLNELNRKAKEHLR